MFCKCFILHVTTILGVKRNTQLTFFGGGIARALQPLVCSFFEYWYWIMVDYSGLRRTRCPNKIDNLIFIVALAYKQESPAVADKPVRRLRKVCTVYVRAVGL